MQQNAEKQLLAALSKFKLARDWVAINGCIQNIKEVCLNFRDEIYDTPHTLLLSKTLSQCLSPTLPAGVQSSALDVYSLIFETAGEARLLRDFYIWAPGVLQFFHSAGVSQRVTTLKLFSDFFIPLIPSNHRLGPPIILSILPGLMDEGTEVQSLDYQALDIIKRSLGSIQFWRAMFRAALTHPNTRSAFLAFTVKSDPFSEFHDVGNNQPKNEKSSETKNEDLNDVRLIISLFTILFNDSNVLIIRSALELFKNSYSKFQSEEVKSDLSLKCINLLSNENKSIRRRVFQWITENINSKIVHIAVSNAYPEAVKVALEKGDDIKKMIVENCLSMILSRGQEFDISIFFTNDKLVELKTLLKAASNISSIELKGKTKLDHALIIIDAHLRIIHHSRSSTPPEIRNELLIETLQKFVELKNVDVKKNIKDQIIIKLADLTLLLVDGFDFDEEKIKAIAKEAINAIFSDFKNIKTCLQLAVKILSKIQLDADFNLLVTTTEKSVFSFSSIDSLVTLSKTNLYALIALDENADKCITYCWHLLSLIIPTVVNSKRSFFVSDLQQEKQQETNIDLIHKMEGEIRNTDHHLLTSIEMDYCDLSELQILEKKVEICKILVQLYYSYPSKFAISIDKNWDPTSIFTFISYTSEIPIPLLIVAQNKIKKQKKKNSNNELKQKVTHFDNFNLLRMICGHSQLLLSDTKRILSNASTTNDYDYMNVIIESLTNLVNVDNKLFIKSMSDSSLINFISLLLTFNSLSSNLLYSILSVSEFSSSDDCSFLSPDVLTEISGLIENYILSNVSDSWSFRLIIPVSLYLQNSSISAFIDLIPKHPSMLNSILYVLEKISSSDSHYTFLDSLCQRIVELLSNLQSKSFLASYFDEATNSSLDSLDSNSSSSFVLLIGEPLLNDITRLFRLIISRTENEISEARATVKSSTLRRILTSVEDLSNDDCIASLTVSYIIQDESNTRYSSLAPKYLPQILSVAFNSFKILSIQSMLNLPSLTLSSPSSVVMNTSSSDNNFVSSLFASKFVVPFFLSLDNTWKLLFFYALSVTNSARMMQSVASAISPLVQDNQMAYYIKSLIQVLSYNESSDKSDISSFCQFIETLLYLQVPVFQTNSDSQSSTSTTGTNANATSNTESNITPSSVSNATESNPLSSLIVNIQSSASIVSQQSTASAASTITSTNQSGTFNPSSTIEIIPVFASIFTQLHISSSNIIKLILTYQICFPQASLSALQVPFMNALNDAKTNQEELQNIISFISMLENKETILKKSIFKSYTRAKITLLFTKVFSLCDKSAIQYPFFISKFCSFDPENTDWATTSIISMLSDPSFFQNGINYLSTAINAIKNVSKVAGDKLVPLVFELLSKSSSDTGIMWINMRSSSAAEASATRNLKILSFVILSCDVDFFANKQQFINQQLLHFLSVIESSGQSSSNNSGNASTTSISQTNASNLNGGNQSNQSTNLNQNISYPNSNQASSKNISAFKTFALLMKSMFMRFSPKFIESFMPVINNELTCALTSEDDNIRAQAEVLLRAAIVTIPASFQFTEFAFIPDLITFPGKDFAQNKCQTWPIIKESTDSLIHLAQPEMLKRSNVELDLLREFLESIE